MNYENITITVAKEIKKQGKHGNLINKNTKLLIIYSYASLSQLLRKDFFIKVHNKRSALCDVRAAIFEFQSQQKKGRKLIHYSLKLDQNVAKTCQIAVICIA